MNIPTEWGLSSEQLRKIFEVEIKLAKLLREANSASERKLLYTKVYDEYFKALPFHPQFKAKNDEKNMRARLEYQLGHILPFLKSNDSFLEIGAGDCSVSIALGRYCKKVTALEVNIDIVSKLKFPTNVECIIFDGFQIPLDSASVEVAFSNQLIEHLHADDANEHFKEVLKVLKKGGVYICITPNRLIGPNDISRFFTDKLMGFHLKEYSGRDLKKMFLRNGFKKVTAFTLIKGKKIRVPFAVVVFLEFLIANLPKPQRFQLLKLKPLNIIFNAIIAGIK